MTIELRQQPQRRRCVGRTAADPGRDRQLFFERKPPRLEAVDALLQGVERLQHQIIVGLAAGGGKRTGHVERQAFRPVQA